jgi:hypothetical protein
MELYRRSITWGVALPIYYWWTIPPLFLGVAVMEGMVIYREIVGR